MTLQALPAPVVLSPFLPAVMGNTHTSSTTGTGIGSEATITLDAAGDGVALVFTAQAATMVDAISFVVATVTTAGTAGSIEATVQTLDSSGNPSGTPVASSNTATATISTAGNKEIAGIAGSATLTVGAQYALVLTAGSGWDRNLAIRITWGAGGQTGYPYFCSKTTGSWGKGSQTVFGYFMGAKDSGGNPILLTAAVGAATITNQSFSNATNPDERGNRFTLAAPATCIGIAYSNAAGSTPGSADAYGVALYSGHTTSPSLLASANPDGDAQMTHLAHVAIFDAPVDLAANTVYCVTIKATSTDTLNVARFGYGSAGDAACLMGANFYATTRDGGASVPTTGGNTFTDDSSSVYCVWPILSKFDDATGGGGGGTVFVPQLSGLAGVVYS